jgi:hypothetical protein
MPNIFTFSSSISMYVVSAEAKISIQIKVYDLYGNEMSWYFAGF